MVRPILTIVPHPSARRDSSKPNQRALIQTTKRALSLENLPN